MPGAERSDSRDTRRANRALILRLLRQHGRLSGYDLSKRSGLSPTATYDVLEELVAAGVVVNEGTGRSRGGRPPVLYALNPFAGYVIGASVGADVAIAETFSLGGVSVREAQSAVERGPGGRALAALLEAIARAGSGLSGPILGIGVAVPGLVDPDTGTVVMSLPLEWEQVPLGRIVASRFRVPVCVDNACNAAAQGEAWYGAGRGHDNFVYVQVDDGIEAGFVLGGRLHRGSAGLAGAMGHMVVAPDGPACRCGRRGCLEALASAPAIVRRYAGHVPPESARASAMDLAQVLQAAYAGDVAARRVLQETGRWLGLSLANVINLLGPSAVVIAGRVADSGPLLWEPMLTEVHRALPAGLPVRVTRGELAQRAVVLGAAALVFEQVFSPDHESWLPGFGRAGRGRMSGVLQQLRGGGETRQEKDGSKVVG